MPEPDVPTEALTSAAQALHRIADVLEAILQFAKEDAERYAPKEPSDVSS